MVVHMEPTSNPSNVRFCVTAFTDLLGFSNHLETGANDLRTEIGKAVLERLQNLEDALKYVREERKTCPGEYPEDFAYRRINDALILTMDLPKFLTPGVGELVRNGISAAELDEYFDEQELDVGVEEFVKIYAAKQHEATKDLAKFVGMTARVHDFLYRIESKGHFPGAKTIVSSGFRTIPCRRLRRRTFGKFFFRECFSHFFDCFLFIGFIRKIPLNRWNRYT